MNRTLWVALGCAALASCREAPPAPTPAPEVRAAPPAAAPGSTAPSAPGRVTLLFSASKAGQLVPCGCSPDQRGGLPREVELVNKVRAENPDAIYVDAGDLLFDNPARPAAQLLRQKESQARTLAQGEELLGAAARVVGLRDLALGPA